ncbi:MAG: peptidase T [Solirubrobacterales bacterium]|nr:peptidase T [Solirubrobacterales bacterium]
MSAAYTSPLAEDLAPGLLERFLRYVRVDTQSARGRDGSPSTPGQLELGRLLVAELEAAGLQGASLDDNGYVTASLPATVEGPVPVICLVAHLDTSPDESGAGVEPIVRRDYGGEPIELPRGGTVLDPAEHPQLAAARGHDLITTSGDTLLGADDKAGVAEIVTAVAHLVARPQLPRPELRVCLTPDEEVGEGATLFDIDGIGADCAYTMDGSELGELQDETFEAAEMTIEITGVEAHPGFATGKLVNALRLMGRVLAALPADRLTPETTSGREGFIHAYELTGSATKATLRAIVRDFDEERLEAHCELLRRTAEEVCASEPRARLRVEAHAQYPNMRRYLEDFPRVTAAAEEAIRAEGIEPRRVPIRGGTDGSILSARGLPTPNIFTGGHDYHSVREWASLQEMSAAAATIVHLAEVWTRPEYRDASASA